MNRWAILISSLLASTAMGVSTLHWTHTSEADFKQGTLHAVVATNLGDLKLSRAIKTLLEQETDVSSVYSLAEAPDKTIYAGTGPQGVILQIKDDKVTKFASLDEAVNVTSLLIDTQGRLLAGTSGDAGKIVRFEAGKDKPTTIFDAEGVQYVWAMKQSADGTIYAATGPSGQLYEIKPDGTHKVLLKCDENNLVSLVTDGADTLYVGTDPNGLVYRINRKTGESFVMFDAPETEISALALDANGTLYAGTGQTTGEAGAGLPVGVEGAKEQTGRPEQPKDGSPIPHEPPKMPNPNPGQPNPEPKEGEPNNLDARWDVRRLHHNSFDLTTGWFVPAKPDGGTKAVKPDHMEGDGPVDPPPAPPQKPGGPGMNQPGAMLIAPNGSGDQVASTEGNAVYRIDQTGAVTEIFRQPNLTVFSLLERDGLLFVGTGNDGTIYQLNPSADEVVVLAKVDSKEVMALLSASDGRIVTGLANAGAIAAMGSGFSTDGTFTSAVLDAQQISQFGKLQMHGSLPKGTGIKVATRSGNMQEPSEASWSKWTDDVPASEFVEIKSPSSRFLQYRLTLTSESGKESPVVEDINVAYLPPNLAPVVKSIKLTTNDKTMPAPNPAGELNSPAPASQRHQTIAWEAIDPNNDALEYTLHFRIAPKGPWIALKDKLKETTFDWDTRLVADGRYEIRVTASDAKSNAVGMGKSTSRVSDAFVVDNTAPVIGDIKIGLPAPVVAVEATVADRASTVAGMDYSVDSVTDWQAVAASDKMFDSPQARISLKIAGLTPGAHQITLRATDAHGNQAFETVTVRVETPTEK